MKKQRQSVAVYLKLAQERGVDPNFYLSEPYLQLSGAVGWCYEGWCWLEADRWCLFPPLDDKPIAEMYPKAVKRIWSDFYEPNEEVAEIISFPFTAQFLDWEYLFDPAAFNDMSGGCWETFRKNCRKWPRNRTNWTYCDRVDHQALVQLLTDWLTAKRTTIQDGEFLARYVLNTAGVLGIHRRCLYDANDQLVAVNVWDANWQYINYRVCIVKAGEPFLGEFARWLFYTDGDIRCSGKLVNDGGVVDQPGLEAFKDKMNPTRKRRVHSWIR